MVAVGEYDLILDTNRWLPSDAVIREERISRQTFLGRVSRCNARRVSR